MKRMLAIFVMITMIFVMPVFAAEEQSACVLDGTASAVEGDMNDISLWEKGSISASGGEYKASNSTRTKDYIADQVALIYAENDYVFRAAVYDMAENFLGFWNGKEIAAASKVLYYLNPQGLEGYKLRLICQRLGADTMDVSECANIHFLGNEQKEISSTPTLTFIDDDGSYDALKNWESICDETGIEITSALVTNAMGDDNDPDRTKASWDDVARLQEKGFEFVSHTHNHINVLKTSDNTCETDFAASIAALREHGCEYRYLVYPYNATSSQKISLVKQYFEAAVGLGGSNADPGSDNTLPVYTHWLRRYSINEAEATTKVDYNGQTVEAHSFKDLDTLKGYIDDAIINNGWVIIMTHLRNDGVFYHNAQSRQMIVELCQYAREKGVQIQTFGEAYSRFKNITETGNQSVYGDSHYIVDCNGVAHYRGRDENGHIAETIPGKWPNCSETGLTEGARCAVCNEILVAQEEIPVTGEHIYDNDNDAVCNVCYDIRGMVDTFTFADCRVTYSDGDASHTNPRVVVYNIGEHTITDPSDEAALKAIDSDGKTYWNGKNINKILLTDAGNYILLLKYNVPTGAVVRVPLRVTVSSAPKLFVEDNRLTVVDNFADNINHRLTAYYLGDQTVEDIYDEAALKAIDPTAKTYWGLDKINKLILQKAGNYAVLLHYNEGKSAKKTVALMTEAAALSEPVIEGLGADHRLVVTDGDTTHTHHRATVYYLGDRSVEDFDVALLAAADPEAKTYWGLNKLNKVQLDKKGNYAVVLHYNLSNGAKRTANAAVYVDLETPVLSAQNGKLVAADPKDQYINHRATVYYLGEQTVEDIYDEAELKAIDPTAKTYWGLDKINKVSLTCPGSYVVVFRYNLPGSAKMTVAAKINI